MIMIKDFLTIFPSTLEISKNRVVADISTLVGTTVVIDNFEEFNDTTTSISFIAFTVQGNSTNVYYANLPISALIDKYNDYLLAINEDFTGVNVSFVKINDSTENEYISINFV